MSPFTFENAYPTPNACSMVEDEDEDEDDQEDFGIGSDASDADLLELKQELKEN